MIKKLQRKFIIIAMGSMMLVMIILLGSINGINLYRMDQQMNVAIKILAENKGRFPKFEKEKPPSHEPFFGFQMNAETPYTTRYFTVEINNEGGIIHVNTSNVAAIESEDALDYAEEVIEREKSSGYLDSYKYKLIQQDEEFMIVFIDCKDEIQTAMVFLRTSIIVALGNLFLVFLLVSILSKKAIQPYIENMEKQKQFITDAGHEIKTPLAIISANADVLELTEGQNEWITSIRNQTNRLDKLIKNLLTLSKMNEGIKRVEFMEFDISNTVMEAAGPFQTIAERQRKKFQMTIQPDIKFHGDEESIHQLVSTLVDNAVKYASPEGEIRVIFSSAAKRGVVLQVCNTAEELDTRNLNRLFDRFYRADFSRARETGGYGIGLSIAKSIVESHHGKISVKSEDGKWIHFTVKM